MIVSLTPNEEKTIRLGPFDHESDFLVSGTESYGQVYMSRCEVGNVALMEGLADLHNFGRQRRIPRGLPITVTIKSHWKAPVQVDLVVLRRAS